MVYKGITFIDFSPKWLDLAVIAVDWLEGRNLLVPCSVKFKLHAKQSSNYGAYWPTWNTVSIYPLIKKKDFAPLLVHELIHAWQEVHSIPEMFFLGRKITTETPKREKYLVHAVELHANYWEGLFRKQFGYPLDEVYEEYKSLGIDLLKL